MKLFRRRDEPEPPAPFFPEKLTVTSGPPRVGLYWDGGRWRDHEDEQAEEERVRRLEESARAREELRHAGRTDGFEHRAPDFGRPANLPPPQ